MDGERSAPHEDGSGDNENWMANVHHENGGEMKSEGILCRILMGRWMQFRCESQLQRKAFHSGSER